MSRLRWLVGTVALIGGLVLMAPAPSEAATVCPRAGAQAAAQKYLDALTDRNAAWTIPLDPFVQRVENGLLTAATAADLRADLYLHVQYSVFTSIEDVVWTWKPDGRPNVINAVYSIPVGLGGVPMGTSTVDEDFTITAVCTIKHIDATFTIPPPV